MPSLCRAYQSALIDFFEPASVQPSAPRRSCWNDFSSALPNAPAAKALDAMLQLGLHDAKLSSELQNDFQIQADGADLCDKHSLRCGGSWPTPSPLPADEEARLLCGLLRDRLQSLASLSALHVCLRECGAFLRAQILRLESMQICPAACRAGPVREFVFLAYLLI